MITVPTGSSESRNVHIVRVPFRRGIPFWFTSRLQGHSSFSPGGLETKEFRYNVKPKSHVTNGGGPYAGGRWSIYDDTFDIFYQETSSGDIGVNGACLYGNAMNGLLRKVEEDSTNYYFVLAWENNGGNCTKINYFKGKNWHDGAGGEGDDGVLPQDYNYTLDQNDYPTIVDQLVVPDQAADPGRSRYKGFTFVNSGICWKSSFWSLAPRLGWRYNYNPPMNRGKLFVSYTIDKLMNGVEVGMGKSSSYSQDSFNLATMRPFDTHCLKTTHPTGTVASTIQVWFQPVSGNSAKVTVDGVEHISQNMRTNWSSIPKTYKGILKALNQDTSICVGSENGDPNYRYTSYQGEWADTWDNTYTYFGRVVDDRYDIKGNSCDSGGFLPFVKIPKHNFSGDPGNWVYSDVIRVKSHMFFTHNCKQGISVDSQGEWNGTVSG